LSATLPYTSARAKPRRRSKHRRRSSRSDSRWRSGVANCPQRKIILGRTCRARDGDRTGSACSHAPEPPRLGR
jgi:hypothetical protein